MSTDYKEARELLDEAIENGIDPDVIAEHLDSLIDWRTQIPGPIGVVLEALDGHAARAIVTATRRTVKRARLFLTDPAYRARRKAERAAEKIARAPKHKAARQKAAAAKKARKVAAKPAKAKSTRKES